MKRNLIESIVIFIGMGFDVYAICYFLSEDVEPSKLRYDSELNRFIF